VVSVGVAIATDPVGFLNENGSLIAHTTLGVAAMLSIPLISSAAALADAGLYVSEGNYSEAGLALLGVIPGGAALKYGGLAVGAVGGTVVLAKGYKTFRAGKGLTKLEDAGGLTARLEKIGVSYVDDGAKALKSCARGHSFSADTAVATAGGETPIGAVEVGDSVLAYDPETGETASHTVTAVMVHTDPIVEHLSTDVGSIETTPNHRFFSSTRGWVEAGDLRPGERIRTANGTDALVIGFTLDATPSDMYDLTVESAHSFFVGSGGLLVHNKKSPCSGGPPISMDEAVSRGTSHVNSDAIMETTPRGNYQFRSTETMPDGSIQTRLSRFDINPSSTHVQRKGPHLNLEVQVNGRQTQNLHFPIDPSSIRAGDFPS
jgi:hypothetical protein